MSNYSPGIQGCTIQKEKLYYKYISIGNHPIRFWSMRARKHILYFYSVFLKSGLSFSCLTCLVVTVKSRPTVWFRQSSNLQTVQSDKRAFAGLWLRDRQHRDGFVLWLNVGDTPCLVARQTVRSLWPVQAILFNQVVSFTAVMLNRNHTTAEENP